MQRWLAEKDDKFLGVSTMLVYIGTILYRKGVLFMAMGLFSEALQIGRAALGYDQCNMAFVLHKTTLVHQQRGCYEETVKAYLETLHIEKLVLGDRHRDVSMMLLKLGEVTRPQGSWMRH